jgi:UDP-N-acetylmuramyl pentapeptide phosphotransferase/UDP-N-acetylglucosamine-1-phosphate transferase
MIETYMIIICASAAFLSFVGTYSLRHLSGMFGTLRQPNARDNHKKPVPKGAGIAVMISAISFLCVLGTNGNVLFALTMLTFVSAIDDYKGLSPLIRLVFHVMAAIIIVGQLPTQIAPMIPYAIEYAVLVLGLVWFMNMYNFMDGIDEITAAQTTMICLGFIMAALIAPNVHNAISYDSMVIISAVAGFWYFNRHPASIFLGDSGSIPLGALIGWLLISLASKGLWVQALMLPAYYMVDAGLTFAKRLLTGHKPWEAHSQHAYQIYVRSGRAHNFTAKIITIYNIAMLTAFGASFYFPQFKLVALGATYAGAFILYIYFISAKGKNNSTSRKIV